MSNFQALRSTLLAAILPCAFAVPAYALSPLTYVSAAGTDTGGCSSLSTACRTFVYAIGQTTPGGVMTASTAGNFGRLTINKAITVSGVPGATVKPAGASNAIDINAPSAAVEISGLEIEGSSFGANAVDVANAGKLTLKNCNIHNFSGDGIIFRNSTKFLIEDTILSNLGGSGVSVRESNPVVTVGALNRVSVNGAFHGVFVHYNNRVSVTDTVVVNSDTGYRVMGLAKLEISNSSARHNVSYGIFKEGTATVESAGNNFFRDNGTNISGTITSVGMK